MAKGKTAETKQKQSPDSRQQEVLAQLQTEFYKDGSTRLMILAVLLSIIVIILGAIIYFIFTHPPRSAYFALTDRAEVMTTPPFIPPVNQPYYPAQPELIAWAYRAAVAAFTFNYVEFEQQITNTKNIYFTEQGASEYFDVLKSPLGLKYVQENKLLISAVGAQAPTIIDKASAKTLLNGRWWWDIEIALVVNYQNINVTRKIPVTLTMRIIRTDPSVDAITETTDINGLKGIAVDSFKAKFTKKNMNSAPGLRI